MSLSEFEIIKRYFTDLGARRDDVVLGVGDDCAILSPGNANAIVTVDTLVSDVHFDQNTPVEAIGYKSVAVSLSDIAAMAAQPAWLTLALTLPKAKAETTWFSQFSQGVTACCNEFNVSLVRGNLTHGSTLSITSQLIGLADSKKVLRRGTAKPGDDIYVSGQMGLAGLGLLLHQDHMTWPAELASDRQILLNHHYQPSPRIDVGLALQPIANACIDLSDGLAADLSHLLQASKVGASINLETVPYYSHLALLDNTVDWPIFSITAGEDYELCFTSAPKHRLELVNLATQLGVKLTRIGQVEAESGLRCFSNGLLKTLDSLGYQHFK